MNLTKLAERRNFSNILNPYIETRKKLRKMERLTLQTTGLLTLLSIYSRWKYCTTRYGKHPLSSNARHRLVALPNYYLKLILTKQWAQMKYHLDYLKEVSSEIAPCLSLVFRASLKQGILPSDWKTALVTPLFKKGSRNDPCNYCPISLTSVCCKVFEYIIYSNIMSHLEEFQYGFRGKRSAEFQLICTLHDFALND